MELGDNVFLAIFSRILVKRKDKSRVDKEGRIPRPTGSHVRPPNDMFYYEVNISQTKVFVKRSESLAHLRFGMGWAGAGGKVQWGVTEGGMGDGNDDLREQYHWVFSLNGEEDGVRRISERRRESISYVFSVRLREDGPGPQRG